MFNKTTAISLDLVIALQIEDNHQQSFQTTKVMCGRFGHWTSPQKEAGHCRGRAARSKDGGYRGDRFDLWLDRSVLDFGKFRGEQSSQ
jgi:hypothetical protein